MSLASTYVHAGVTRNHAPCPTPTAPRRQPQGRPRRARRQRRHRRLQVRRGVPVALDRDAGRGRALARRHGQPGAAPRGDAPRARSPRTSASPSGARASGTSGRSSSRSCCSASAARSRSSRASTTSFIQRAAHARFGVELRRPRRVAGDGGHELPRRDRGVPQARRRAAAPAARSSRRAIRRSRSCSRRTRPRSWARSSRSLAVAANALTGQDFWDPLGSVVIGALLCAVALVIAQITHGLLIGESATPEDRAAGARSSARRSTGVEAVTQLLTMHLGPDVTWSSR